MVRMNVNGVDKTGAFGGPWNADTGLDDLEIVSVLTDEQGHPLRQTNVLEFWKDSPTVGQEDALDLIVEARSWVSSLTIVRVA